MASKRLSRAALRQRAHQLARRFAADLFALLDKNGIWEAAPPTDTRTQTRVRRTEAALEEACRDVLAIIRRARDPIAISDVAAALDLAPREVGHPLALLVAEGKVVRTGTRRGARYRAPAGKSMRPPGNAPRPTRAVPPRRK